MTNTTITLKAKAQSSFVITEAISEVIKPTLVETEKKTANKVNMKGDVITTPVYSELKTKAVCEFKFRRYKLVYTVKIYSNLGANNLAKRMTDKLEKDMETVLYNAVYREEKFTPTTGKYAGVECTSYQIIVNG